jgi:putative transposase
LFLALKIENQPSTLHTKLLLYRDICGIIKNKKSTLYRINGIEDDIHIMSDLHPSVCPSDYVKEIKVASSLWMKASGNFLAFEGWQDG